MPTRLHTTSLMRARHGADRIELQAAEIAHEVENTGGVIGGIGIVQALPLNE